MTGEKRPFPSEGGRVQIGPERPAGQRGGDSSPWTPPSPTLFDLFIPAAYFPYVPWLCSTRCTGSDTQTHFFFALSFWDGFLELCALFIPEPAAPYALSCGPLLGSRPLAPLQSWVSCLWSLLPLSFRADVSVWWSTPSWGWLL